MTKWTLFNTFVNMESIRITHREFGCIIVKIKSIQLEDGSGHCFNLSVDYNNTVFNHFIRTID